MISETNIDNTFPTSLFIISCFAAPFRSDLTDEKGGIHAYTRKNIPSKILKTLYIHDHTECLTIEINLRKTK